MDSSSSTRRPVRALVVIAVAVTFLSSLLVARAEDPADARLLWEAGRASDAHDALLRFLLEEPTDPTAILDAARLAAEMRDLDLAERVQGRAEITGRTLDDPDLDLALGTVYLAIGEIRLSTGVSGPTLAFLFADAETLAEEVISAHPGGRHECDARTLLARARRAVGDLDGAIEALQTETKWPGRPLLLGKLHYERAVTKHLDASGRPTEEGTADLQRAIEHLMDSPDGPGTMTWAWALHRYGDVGGARSGYVMAWRRDPSSDLPLRGLRSLLADRPDDLVKAVMEVAAQRPDDTRVLDALAEAYLAAGDATGTIATIRRRIALDPTDAAGWHLGGRLFFALGLRAEAEDHLATALIRDPSLYPAWRLMEQVAQSYLPGDPARTIAVYRRLTRCKPDDAIIWSNLGFVLLEVVSPHTTLAEDGTQTLKADAPARARADLEACLAAYAEATRLVPEDVSDLDERRIWILAGIVNDYGLMLHYFTDVQDLAEAESLYLRALEMTEYAYKDTYAPNLRRLYGLLEDSELRWYRVAERARYAQSQEAPAADGGFDLVPDIEKQELAAQDAQRLRARLEAELREDAEADADPWPPASR